jgi:hypothetical protein
MKKLDSASKVLVLISASAASLAAGPLFETFKPAVGQQGSFAITIILFAATIGILQIAFEGLINNVAIIRRLILGKSFIEGYWIDGSQYPKAGAEGIACLYIHYEDGQLAISGTTFRITDAVFASWDTKFAALNNRTLAYTFEAHTNTSNSAVEVGYGELKFVVGDGIPKSYSGFFFDTTQRCVITVLGEKVSDPHVIRQLENSNTRMKCLRELHAKRKNPAESTPKTPTSDK